MKKILRLFAAVFSTRGTQRVSLVSDHLRADIGLGVYPRTPHWHDIEAGLRHPTYADEQPPVVEGKKARPASLRGPSRRAHSLQTERCV